MKLFWWGVEVREIEFRPKRNARWIRFEVLKLTV